MVEHLHVEERAGVDNLSCKEDIFGTGSGVARGVVG
jgi:hypothetical protein